MTVTRVHTDAEGRSRFEDLHAAAHPGLRAPSPARSVFLKEFPAGTVLPRHPAPRRMWVVLASGRLEIEVADGVTRRFGPGDVRIMEDTTGEGHVTRVLGDEPAIAVVIPLDAPA